MKPSARMKPTSVMPARRAAWTASEVGALDRHQRAEAGGPGLLHELDRGPAADEQAAPRRRQHPFEQQGADDLVDGVVATDVLAGDDDPARRVERRRGVDRAGRAEQPLPAEHGVGHRREHVVVDRVRGRAAGRAGRAARRSGRCRTSRSSTSWCRGDRSRRGARPPVSTVTTLKCDAVGRAVGAVAHAGHRRAGEQPVGEAEPRRQLVVVARRAHRRRDDGPVELDRHRLLDDELVGPALRVRRR